MRRTPGGLIAISARSPGVMTIWMLMLGCSERSDAGDGSTSSEDTGISAADESDSGTDTDEPVWCTDESCDAECSLMLDDCEQPMDGQCTSGTCHCHSSEPCINCESDADCGQWQRCSREFGCTPCWTSWDFAWDLALACMLDLAGVDSLLFGGYIAIEIAAEPVPITDSCELTPTGMILDGLQMQVQLCPDACAAFEAAGSLVLQIHCPGPP